MSYQLTHDEINAALAAARTLGWVAPHVDDGQPGRRLSGLEMERVLRAAYDCPVSQPSEVRSLAIAREALHQQISRARGRLVRLDREAENREREIDALRSEKAEVLEPERLLHYVRRLVQDLTAAGWPIATEAFRELQALTEERPERE